VADAEAVLQALTAAIEGAFTSNGEFPTRWVLIAEGVGVDDNERGLWLATSEGAKPWETLGLMQHAIHIEQARTVWNDRPEV
jgi:hypothetical protein